MLRTLAARLRAAQEEITALSLKNVTARLSARLLDLSHRHGVPAEGGVEVDLNLSRQELGSLIGASRETTTRLLHQFQREGVLKIDGSKLLSSTPTRSARGPTNSESPRNQHRSLHSPDNGLGQTPRGPLEESTQWKRRPGRWGRCGHGCVGLCEAEHGTERTMPRLTERPRILRQATCFPS